jgi:phage-related tail protein
MISQHSKKQITDEFKTISNLMTKESDILRNVYYFSGAYAVVQRVINLDYDPSLVLMHNVLQYAHNAVNGRIISIAKGEENVIRLPDNTMSKLRDYLDELRNQLIKDGDLLQPLTKIATIGYITTGNGYYLYQKGVLKLA